MAVALDTIAAIATAHGAGAVGLLRVSGDLAIVNAIATMLCGGLPVPRRATLRQFRDAAGHLIDSGMVIYFQAPRSYTGEHVLELQAHGSPPVLATLLDASLQAGARLARAGEFTERAFLNGKLDLLQAEAVADLIAAASLAEARDAMNALAGQASASVQALAVRVIQLRAEVEARIDFSDELEDSCPDPAWWAELSALEADVAAASRRIQSTRLQREGLKVVLVGPPNAGKSTLFNRLLDLDRAMVSATAGTTRDTLNESLLLDDQRVLLQDTAGLHDSDDALEAEGMRRARAALKAADVIVEVNSPDTTADDRLSAALAERSPEALLIRVQAKSDLIATAEVGPDLLSVSAHTGRGLPELRSRLRELVGTLAPGDGPGLGTARHAAAFRTLSGELAAAAARGQAQDWVLCAEHLRLAQRALATVTGEERQDEAVLGEIFARFCIGK
jgi:tRNA modification GTPase